ncbi:MAG TPA: ATP-dependent 6-phosphofructokinase [Acidimicrobiia bacterium]|nr:ATP-dependent 6-phosphofructokinase [Acidimicrobiia bacterium]
MGSIGVLTAGGDCPGLNAAIRAVVTRITAVNRSVVGIEEGWAGLMDGRVRTMTLDEVRGVVGRGGTILGTSRRDPYVHGDGFDSIRSTIDQHDIEAVVVIGGDGSLRTAAKLEREGLPIVGIPKTIDNDIAHTDVSLGFHTAVQIVVDAIDRLATTAESHNRIMVIEVMGRTTGWIATAAGLAGGAHAILVPEVEVDYEDLARRIVERHESGPDYSVIVVAEGTPGPGGAVSATGKDQYGFTRIGGVCQAVAAEIERLTTYEARPTILGYLQRGGTPTAFDRVLGTRFGVKAAEMAIEGGSGVMVALHGEEIVPVDLAQAAAAPRALDLDAYREASWFLS